MAVDLMSLTLGEVEYFEEHTGKSFDTALEEGSRKGRPLTTLVHIFLMRENSGATYAQAQKYTLDDALEFLGMTEESNDAAPSAE